VGHFTTGQFSYSMARLKQESPYDSVRHKYKKLVKISAEKRDFRYYFIFTDFNLKDDES
tara:strand:- start:782 stop:958 length:177 start_codon:yes stop_codon:yes gene_type:complete